MKSLPMLAAPAVGWPLFVGLGFLYFAMAYLLLGSLFLAIGGMASTVREVQTLSMPVTMLQLMVFFFASYALARPALDDRDRQPRLPAFLALRHAGARGALGELWPHVLALGWQALWVALIGRGPVPPHRDEIRPRAPEKARKGLMFMAFTASEQAFRRCSHRSRARSCGPATGLDIFGQQRRRAILAIARAAGSTRMISTQVSSPMKSASSSGPIGWLRPRRQALSISTMLAVPPPSTKTASLSIGIRTRLTMNPASSCESTITLLSRPTSACIASIVAGAVARPG
jgi:hypothetical protein